MYDGSVSDRRFVRDNALQNAIQLVTGRGLTRGCYDPRCHGLIKSCDPTITEHEHDDVTKVLQIADRFAAHVWGTTRLVVSIGTPYPRGGTAPTEKEKVMSQVTLNDGQQVNGTISTEDDRHFATADTITYEVGDTNVVTVTGADDDDSHTFTLVAGAPGTTTVKATDSSAQDASGNPLSVDIDVMVTTGPTTAISVTFDAPTDQPPATPAP